MKFSTRFNLPGPAVGAIVLFATCIPAVLTSYSYTNLDDFGTTKIFYKPDEANYELVEYQSTLETFTKLEKLSSVLKAAGGIPEIGIVFKVLDGVIGTLAGLAMNKDAAFWGAVQQLVDTAVMREKLSSLRAKMATFRETFAHVKTTADEGTMVAGVIQIIDILNQFEEAGSILRKTPLHSAPLLLQFLPIVKIYVDYTAKIFGDGGKKDWRLSLLTKAMMNLVSYKQLAIQARKDALKLYVWRGRTSHWGDSYYWTEDFDPKSDRRAPTPTALPEVRCLQPKHNCAEMEMRIRYAFDWNGACALDRFTGKVLLIPNGDNYPNSQNCVNDLYGAYDLLYQTVFWRIGSLIM